MNLKRISELGFKRYLAELLISKAERYLKKQEQIKNDNLKKKWTDQFVEGQQSIIYQIPESNCKLFLFKDSYLSELIFHGFERDEILFVKNNLQTGDYFIDIGANIGYFSISAAEIVGENGKVFCFEPNEDVFTRLNQNTTLNHFESIIQSYNVGLSDKEEKLNYIKFGSGRDAWNSFAINQSDNQGQLITVDVFPLVKVMSKEDFKKVKIIKIDVEGWEKNVLMGMKDYISFHKPILLVEFTDSNFYNAGYTSFDLYNLIISFGYEAYEISGETVVKSNFRGYYPYNNLVFKNAENLSR
jgi:FkbM family methyltransferase